MSRHRPNVFEQRALRAAPFVLLAGALASCEATVPDGIFRCADDRDCPSGLACADDPAAGRRFCYSPGTAPRPLGAERGDSGSPEDARTGTPPSDAASNQDPAKPMDGGARDAQTMPVLPDGSASDAGTEGGASGAGGEDGGLPETGAGGSGGSAGGGSSGSGGGGGSGGDASLPIATCAEQLDGCDDDPDACVDGPSGTECRCPARFTGDGRGPAGCVDLDECAQAPTRCGHGGTCSNVGSGQGYRCSNCAAGYEPSSGLEPECVDIDECETANGGCEHGCVNSTGGYECTCNGGYTLQADGRNCVGWSTPVLLERNDTGGHVQSPQVELDPQGNALAVWRQGDEFGWSVWASRQPAGQAWGTPLVIDGSQNETAYAPDLDMDAAGRATVVWYQQGLSGGPNIWVRRMHWDGSWEPVQPLESGMGAAYYPQVAVNPSGHALVVWQQSDGSHARIWANRFDPSTGWSGVVNVDGNPNENSFQPQVALNEDGDAIAIWPQHDGTRLGIRAARASGTGWAVALPVETAVVNADIPRVALDESGNALAAWLQNQNNYWVGRTNRSTAGSGWGTASALRSGQRDGSAPDMVVDAQGDVIAAWYEIGDGDIWSVWTNRFTVGSGWGTAELLEHDDRGDASEPRLAVAAGGEVFAVWRQFDGIHPSIWASRYHPGSGWEAPRLVEQSNSGYATSPQVAANAAGQVVVVWLQSDGTLANLWASKFE